MPKRSSQGHTKFAHERDQDREIIPQLRRCTTDRFYWRGCRRNRFGALIARPSIEIEQCLIGWIKRSDLAGSLSTALTAAELQQEGCTSSITIGQARGIHDQTARIH